MRGFLDQACFYNMVMYIITSKWNSTFGIIGYSSADKMTTKVFKKNKTWSVCFA